MTLENVAKSEFPHAGGRGVPQGIPATQAGTTHSADGPIGHTNNAGDIRVPPSSDPPDLTNHYTRDPATSVPVPVSVNAPEAPRPAHGSSTSGKHQGDWAVRTHRCGIQQRDTTCVTCVSTAYMNIPCTCIWATQHIQTYMSRAHGYQPSSAHMQRVCLGHPV